MHTRPTHLSVVIIVLVTMLFGINANAQVTFVNVQLEIGEEFQVYPNSSAWGDIDNDGDLDAYMSIGSIMGNDIMLNDLSGSGKFIRADTLMAHRARTAGPRSVLMADMENDGDLDLLAVGQDYQIWLIVNKLVETDSLWFEDISEQTGVMHAEEAYYMASMADYDNDGLLDIFVSGLSLDTWTPSLLFHNTTLEGGPLSFEEVADAAGIYSAFGMNMMAGAWGDYDDDGDQDLLIVTNPNTPVFLYRNEGNGTFADVTFDAGLGESVGNSRAIVWGDYDNDGDLDVFIGRRPNNNYPDMDVCQLFRNDGGVFTEVESARITGKMIYGVASADYDNDGDLDLHLLDSNSKDLMLRNDGNNTFTNVVDEVGLGKTKSPFGFDVDIDDRGGQTWADWDADGDLDLLLPGSSSKKPYLMRNDGGNANNWLEVKLTGVQSNRSAVGARVIAISGDLRQMREVCMGSGYISGPPTDVHFGFGQRTIVDSLIIRWPSGNVDAFTDLAVNQILSIEEGSGSTGVEQSPTAQVKDFVLEQNFPNPFNPQTTLTYALPHASQGRIVIVDLLGNKVRSFSISHNSGGHYRVVWDGRDDSGMNVASGVYLYKMEMDGFVSVRKMILVR